MKERGFTLIEIMLVIAALGILAGTIVVAINPLEQMAQARNHQRRIDIAAIWNASQQYMLNNPGQYPANIPSGTLEQCMASPLDPEFTVCKTDSCAVVLGELLDNARYLTEIPSDPFVDDPDYSGYNIIRDVDRNNRITVCAPNGELSQVIYIPQ